MYFYIEYKCQKEVAPVWQDEDDENTEINISHKRRTRKLLKSEEEKSVNGVEYNKRLRELYTLKYINKSFNNNQQL